MEHILFPPGSYSSNSVAFSTPPAQPHAFLQEREAEPPALIEETLI